MTITFNVNIKPKSKDRPRFRGHAYTPKKTKDYETKIADAYKKHCNGTFEGAVWLTLQFVKGVPASWSKERKQLAYDGGMDDINRPDVDNLVKACMDGLTKAAAWNDDKQVSRLMAIKTYGEYDHIRITIEGKMNNEQARQKKTGKANTEV